MRALLATIILSLLVTGCAGYRLGPTGGKEAGARSIQIVPLLNDTLEPRLTDALTAELRKEFQRDGTFKLNTSGDADLRLSGKVTNYRRRTQSLAPNDLATSRDYRLELTCKVTVVEVSSGKVVLDQPITGSTLIRVGSDLTSTERQAMPLLATDVAKHVVAQLADGTW